MKATKSAVAHDQHSVSGARQVHDAADELCERRVHHGAGAQRRQGARKIPINTATKCKGVVGIAQAIGQPRGHHAELHGVRARLDHGQHTAGAALTCTLIAQAGNGGGNGRGMVRKVIEHAHTVDLAPHLQSTLDALKPRHRRTGRLCGHTVGHRSSDCGDGIASVVFARQWRLDLANRAAPMPQLKPIVARSRRGRRRGRSDRPAIVAME